MRGAETGKIDPFLVKLISADIAIAAAIAAIAWVFTALSVSLSLAVGILGAAVVNLAVTAYYNTKATRLHREADMWAARTDQIRFGRKRGSGAS